MKFVCYSDWKQLPDSADELFAEYERESLFLSRLWFENVSQYSLPDDHQIVLACVIDEENQNVLALLPMKQCPQNSLSSLSSNFTSYYSLLIKNNNQQNIIDCFAKGISQMPVKPIVLEPIEASDLNTTRLIEKLEHYGFKSYSHFRQHNWIHHTNGQTFTEYMQARPSNLINTLQRKQRKLSREDEHTFKLYQKDNINQALKDYQHVYQKSWKANEFYSDFTPNLVKQMSERDCLRLGILYIDTQPIAAQIWFIVYSKASIYRLVYDEQWKSYSPGSLLTEYMMQHVIDKDKATTIDFLTGNERYKQDWMTEHRERISVRLAKETKPNNWLNRVFKKSGRI